MNKSQSFYDRYDKLTNFMLSRGTYQIIQYQ